MILSDRAHVGGVLWTRLCSSRDLWQDNVRLSAEIESLAQENRRLCAMLPPPADAIVASVSDGAGSVA